MTRRHALLAGVLGALLIPWHALGATETVTVTIGGTLEPAVVEVAAGTTVTWRNTDDERHRVRSGIH
jgi:plastocyanin